MKWIIMKARKIKLETYIVIVNKCIEITQKKQKKK